MLTIPTVSWRKWNC